MNPNKLISAGLSITSLGLLVLAIAFFVAMAEGMGFVGFGLAFATIGFSVTAFGGAMHYSMKS